jgi:hypothetical protein
MQQFVICTYFYYLRSLPFWFFSLTRLWALQGENYSSQACTVYLPSRECHGFSRSPIIIMVVIMHASGVLAFLPCTVTNTHMCELTWSLYRPKGQASSLSLFDTWWRDTERLSNLPKATQLGLYLINLHWMKGWVVSFPECLVSVAPGHPSFCPATSHSREVRRSDPGRRLPQSFRWVLEVHSAVSSLPGGNWSRSPLVFPSNLFFSSSTLFNIH